MVYETDVRVRYGETDQMGVVYHPNYYIYFEVGRTEFLREMGGISYKELEDSGIMMPIVEAGCKYHIPAKYDDELIVYTAIKAISVARMTFSYRVVRKQDGALLVEGETTLAFISKTGKVVSIKKNNRELYEKFLNLMG